MLELYGSGDPATLKLVICLEELALPYKFHALDLKKLDQWSPAHRSMAPQGEVPVLVDGARVMSDATIALLYLGESHRQANLVPGDPVGQYDAQALNDVLDAALLDSVNLIGWHRQQDGAARAAFNEALAAVPGRQKAAGWSAVWRDAESDRCRRAEDKDRRRRCENRGGARHATVAGRQRLHDCRYLRLRARRKPADVDAGVGRCGANAAAIRVDSANARPGRRTPCSDRSGPKPWRHAVCASAMSHTATTAATRPRVAARPRVR